MWGSQVEAGVGPSLIREAVGFGGGKQEPRPGQLSLDQGSKGGG